MSARYTPNVELTSVSYILIKCKEARMIPVLCLSIQMIELPLTKIVYNRRRSLIGPRFSVGHHFEMLIRDTVGRY